MDTPLQSLRGNRQLLAYTAAAMYGGAAFAGLVESMLPGGPRVSVAPSVVALVVMAFLLAVGPRLPRLALAPLGPLGAWMIAYALASPGPGDGAVLYMWPVLWMTLFFGLRGAFVIVACIGVGHALALDSLPVASAFPGRWIDVMVSISVVAGVVHVLESRNEALLVQLADEARTDPLTGLLNRRGFDERASLELAHARREGRSIAVALFDIDYFKRINDEWGHECGDRVLAHLGSVLRSRSREIDVVARIGGEEFVVLQPDCRGVDAEISTRRIRDALAADDLDLPAVRVSAGVAAGTSPADIESLLERADSALYAAKREGRNRTVLFEGEPLGSGDPNEPAARRTVVRAARL